MVEHERGLNVIVGIGGGIAAYKVCDVIRRLVEHGAAVDVVLTAAASRFVTATTLQALSGRPVRDSLWDASAEASMGHIELARRADVVVLAPATADLIAKAAQGLADDLLTTVLLATTAPLLIAPAMNQQMWRHPATQANLALLQRRGAVVVGPESGSQACGDIGPGRLAEASDIVAAVLSVVRSDSTDATAAPQLAGRRALVTAGPTYEDLDPVRYLGNRSSGQMGLALVRALRRQGAEVTLVAGPGVPSTAPPVRRIDVRSALEMRDKAVAAAREVDFVFGCAAVADFRPVSRSAAKLKPAGDTMTVELVRNPDVIAELAQAAPQAFIVGFAAETGPLEAAARQKLANKRLSMIAANSVSATLGMDAPDNALEVYWQGGARSIGRAPKQQVADQLVDIAIDIWRQTRA